MLDCFGKTIQHDPTSPDPRVAADEWESAARRLFPFEGAGDRGYFGWSSAFLCNARVGPQLAERRLLCISSEQVATKQLAVSWLTSAHASSRIEYTA
jgi:hypothetical protein